MKPVAQKKSQQLLTGFTFDSSNVNTATKQIPYGLVFCGWHIDAGKLSGTKQTHQIERIAPVGFNTITPSFGNKRRGYHGTAMAL
jgi:hypothetical protein